MVVCQKFFFTKGVRFRIVSGKCKQIFARADPSARGDRHTEGYVEGFQINARSMRKKHLNARKNHRYGDVDS